VTAGASLGQLALHNPLCSLGRMPTNLAIDDALLAEAQKAGGHRTKKDTVNEALREYIQRRRQARVVDLFGKVEFDPSFDYKKQRRRT
jgi:Arc/MetJ family transcription regulator